MSGFVSHITGARQAARLASVEARGEQFNAGAPAVLMDGIVTAVTGDTYTVDVLGDDGQVVATFERLQPWPSATLTVDQGVKLIFTEGSEKDPSLFVGGGGGGCYGSILFGALV